MVDESGIVGPLSFLNTFFGAVYNFLIDLTQPKGVKYRTKYSLLFIFEVKFWIR